MNITLKVAALITNSEQKTLLIKEEYDKEQGFKWNLVKGTYDNPQETFEECIKREAKEEANLEIQSVSLKQIYHYGKPENPKTLFIFNAKYQDSQLPSTLNNKLDEHISEIKWFSKDELNKLTPEDCIAPYVFEAIHGIDSENVVINRA